MNGKHYPLPRHSWEKKLVPKHHLPHRFPFGPAPKSLLALVAAFALVIAIFSTLLFAPQLVGYTIAEQNSGTVNVVSTGTKTITVDAALLPGIEASSYYLELTSNNAGFNICEDKINKIESIWDANDNHGQLYGESCVDGILKIGDASFVTPLTGSDSLVKIEFKATFPSNLNLTLNPIDIYDLATANDLFPVGGDFLLSPKAAAVVANNNQGGGSGGSGGSGGGGGGLVSGSSCPPTAELIQGKCVCPAGKQLKFGKCIVDPDYAPSRELKESAPAALKSKSTPPKLQKESPPVALAAKSFWEKYKPYIIGIPVALLLIELIILLHHYLKNRKPTQKKFDINALELWIQHEHAAGTSFTDILTILKDHTGWKASELLTKFPELKEETQKQKHVGYDKTQLKTWIQKEHAAGTPYPDIVTILANHIGWTKEKIKQLFPSLNSPTN